MILAKLKNYKMISQEQLFCKLTCYNSPISKLYALPKIHKPTWSFRPIISSMDAPTQNLSTLICDILTQAYDLANEYCVKGSFQFANTFNEHLIPKNYVLVSLYISFLFTNIRFQVCIDSIRKKCNTISQHCNLPLDAVSSIVCFILNNNHFQFNDRICREILGKPMGESISPIFALDLFGLHVPFLIKYVDDLILAVPKDELLNTSNSYNNKIQFTLEKETNSSVINNTDNKILIGWYVKPSSSGRYLNCLS